MRKKILTISIVAILMATTSLSVVAFDAKKNNPLDVDAEILVKHKGEPAGYQGNLLYFPDSKGSTVNLHPPLPSFDKMELAHNGRGDALIFPFFTQNGAGEWGSEIVVRNTDHEHAIVAKVAVYASDDSREVLDFNIYLSASDVVRFTIKDGFLTSRDGSILRDVPAPQPSAGDYVDVDDFASSKPGKEFKRELTINSGYIVVYGMAQALTDDDEVDSHGLRYHKQHARLFRNYRRELDACRPGWRIGHHNAMENGTYTQKTTNASDINYSVAAPNQSVNCNAAKDEKLDDDALNAIKWRDEIKEKANTAKHEIDKIDGNNINIQSEADIAANAVVDIAESAVDIAESAVDFAKKIFDSGTISNADIKIKNNAEAAKVAAEKAHDDAKDARDDAIVARDATVDAAPDTVEAKKKAIKAISEAKEAVDNAIAASSALVKAAQATIDATVIAIANAAKNPGGHPTKKGRFFGDVEESLTGTIRIYTEVLNKRDMMLPAKAIKNFTKFNKIIYVEGEIGALQDRRIKGGSDADHDLSTPDINKEWARYDELGIREDAKAFLASSTTYTFAKGSTANQLVITQPYKRILVQMGNDDGYWQSVNSKFGGFTYIYNVFNEHEEMDNTPYTHSPYSDDPNCIDDANTDDDESVCKNEVETLRDLEKNTEFTDDNGYALLKFTDVNGNIKKIPAIITQMIGTKVGGIDQLNWIYSQTNSVKE